MINPTKNTVILSGVTFSFLQNELFASAPQNSYSGKSCKNYHEIAVVEFFFKIYKLGLN